VAGPSGPEDLLTGPLILIFHTLELKSLEFRKTDNNCLLRRLFKTWKERDKKAINIIVWWFGIYPFTCKITWFKTRVYLFLVTTSIWIFLYKSKRFKQARINLYKLLIWLLNYIFSNKFRVFCISNETK
jgi:hypothetical protein